MRSSTCTIAALALAFLQGTSALNNAMSRKFRLLADMGLNPDGTPMGADHDGFGSEAGIQSVKVSSTNVSEKIVPEYVELPIDNFAKDNSSCHGTFYNRYWVSTSAYKPGAPVFIYDAGEVDTGPYAVARLQNETGFFRQLLNEYNGIGIVWEHRFYGNSTPVPINVDTPATDFEFLTTEQSLADVHVFAWQFSRKDIDYDLTPENTPWVFVGGSYPGMRAAFMRQKYPDTIYASYASSAPVQARVDQSFYFDPIWHGLSKYGFGNCSRDIQAAVRYMDDIMDTNQTAAAQLKVQFLGPGAANNSHATFADALTTIFGSWQGYGVEGGTTGLRMFCDWLETNPNGTLAGANGQAQTKGAQYVVNRWSTYPPFTPNVNKALETSCSGPSNTTSTNTTSCDLDRKFSDPASISWTWQYCTQWGFFQSANKGPTQLVSKYNSLTHQHDICHRQFPTAPASLLPDWPDVNRTNAIFGGWSIRPSNTYWSNGEFDPWRTLSPASSEPFAPRVRLFTSPLPACGVSQAEGDLFGYVLPDAQHCYDFRAGVAQGVVSRGFFRAALSKWLACFGGGG